MADIAGLVVGTLALATLFSTCVDCMEYIDLAKNYGRDYEIASTKYILLKARLNDWGESLQVSNPGNESQVLRDRWDSVKETVSKALGAIRIMLEDTEKLRLKYGLEEQAIESNKVSYPSGSDPSHALHDLAKVFRVTAKTRQQNGSLRMKVVWAIRNRGQFETLISNLDFCIGSLEKLNERLGLNTYNMLNQLFATRLQEISNPSARLLIDEARATSQDAQAQSPELDLLSQLQPTAEPNPYSSLQNINGFLYWGNVIEGQARGIIGIVGKRSERRQGVENVILHNNTIKGNAKGAIGEVSDEAAAALWKS